MVAWCIIFLIRSGSGLTSETCPSWLETRTKNQMLFGSRWETGSRSGGGAFPEIRAFWKKMLGSIGGGTSFIFSSGLGLFFFSSGLGLFFSSFFSSGLFIFSSGLGLFFFSSGLGLFFFSSAQLQ